MFKYIYNASIWSIQPPTCDPPTKSAHLCVFLTPDTLVASRFDLRKTNPKREREGEKKYIPIYIYIYRYEHIVYMNICVFLGIKTCYRKAHLLGRRFFETGWNPSSGPGGCFHHRGPRCQSKVTSLIPTWPGANKNLPSGKLTVCCWKWPFIVDFPIKMVIFHSFLYVYQRVTWGFSYSFWEIVPKRTSCKSEMVS
jgi:hypothetical protein